MRVAREAQTGSRLPLTLMPQRPALTDGRHKGAAAAWRGSLKARRIAAGGGSGGNRKPPARRRIGSRRPGFGYDPHAYCRAIARACRRAGIVPWHPHQLRHAFGTRAREAFDLEHSQAALGHAHARTAEIYAMISRRKAEAVARRIG